MKERPILFSGAMVRAILDGRKTQTRRALKPDGTYRLDLVAPPDGGSPRCPYGQPGDRLWVRETFSQHPDFAQIAYRADGEEFEDADGWTWEPKWMPSIHMPRRYSRITLEVTGVRVERLQDISEEDAIAEGINCYQFHPDDGYPLCNGYSHQPNDGECGLWTTAGEAYRKLWESINGPGSWDLNPWVWVVEFRRVPQQQ